MNLNLTVPINSLGYGITGINVLKALMKGGHDISLWIIGQAEAHPNDHSFIQEALENARMYDYNAPSVRIWHQHDMGQHIGRGLKIGFPIFELAQLTNVDKYQLQAMDYVFTPSKWAKEVIINNGIKPKDKVFVTPLGVDRSIFNEEVKPTRTTTDTVFFNCGKWEIRKGHDILCQAFNKAFEKDDNVKLIMNCSNPFLDVEGNRNWALTYQNSKLGREGKIIVNPGRLNSQQELAKLMASVDCGVFPSRGEGWNLELLELMAMGKQVITTYYSAHTEFVTVLNSFLIMIEELEPARDGIWFHGQGDWAKMGKNQIDQLVEHLRGVHEFKKTYGSISNYAGVDISKRFTWDNTAKELVNAIQNLHS